MYLLFDFWVPAAIFPLCGHLACRIPKGISIAFHTSLAQHHHPGKCIHKPQKMNGYNMNIPNVINKYIYIYVYIYTYIHTQIYIYIHTCIHACPYVTSRPSLVLPPGHAPPQPCGDFARRSPPTPGFLSARPGSGLLEISSVWESVILHGQNEHRH